MQDCISKWCIFFVKIYILVSGEKQYEPYEIINAPVFSQDGKRIAFSALDKKKWNRFSGDRVFGPYRDDEKPLFLNDDKSIAFPGNENQKYYMIMGNDKLGPYEFISDFALSPDRKKVGFIGGDYRDQHFYLNGEKGPAATRDIIFSPNGQTIAVTVRKNNFEYLQVGKNIFGPYRNLMAGEFSLDGSARPD